MVDGPRAGLADVERIDGLDAYLHYHSTRGSLLEKLGLDGEARSAYRRALELGPTETERAFLIAKLSSG
jgi:RNA polymerase sigma-70 factor (ECF subfamily)